MYIYSELCAINNSYYLWDVFIVKSEAILKMIYCHYSTEIKNKVSSNCNLKTNPSLFTYTLNHKCTKLLAWSKTIVEQGCYIIKTFSYRYLNSYKMATYFRLIVNCWRNFVRYLIGKWTHWLSIIQDKTVFHS